jgi:hypothetical protein
MSDDLEAPAITGEGDCRLMFRRAAPPAVGAAIGARLTTWFKGRQFALRAHRRLIVLCRGAKRPNGNGAYLSFRP